MTDVVIACRRWRLLFIGAEKKTTYYSKIRLRTDTVLKRPSKGFRRSNVCL
jgi:hypothetical protein